MKKTRRNEQSELKDKWYQKLKDQGFEDIEDSNQMLKEHHCRSRLRTERFSKMQLDLKAEYYYQATHFLNTYRFIDEIEKTIWSMHTEGISYRRIACTLRTTRHLLNKDNVLHTVEKLRGELAQFIRRNISDSDDE